MSPTQAGSRAQESARSSRDVPGVIFPPPLIALAAVLIGVGLHLIYPAPFLPEAAEGLVGMLLISAGVVLSVLAFREFSGHRTAISTRETTTALVTTGPYRFSRNPIYVSGILILLGIAAWVNSVWLIATTVATVIILRYGVIAREERYLARKFGPDYARYMSSVRRWV